MKKLFNRYEAIFFHKNGDRTSAGYEDLKKPFKDFRESETTVKAVLFRHEGDKLEMFVEFNECLKSYDLYP